MPIRPELRWLYPIDWAQLSHAIRFGRAGGRCEQCRRPHGIVIQCLPDGRWREGEDGRWRDGEGRRCAAATPEELAALRHSRVVLAAAHLDHDPTNNHPRNLRSLCQRCHMLHDRPYHLAQRRLTYRRRWALGDLFTGPYWRS
ncbi:MAG TPA: hypothetical protein VNR89_09630 [Roseomonas sp.]|nr:hypothetical protein [Roseomonas sp.]